MKAPKIVTELQREGISAGTVSILRLDDLQEDLESLRRAGLIDEGLDEAYLRSWKFSVPDDLPEACSIIVLATPVPKVRLHFTFKGMDRTVILPPTYADGAKIADRCQEALVKAADDPNARFIRAFLPLKTLAARCGLVRYGRNNITYMPKTGSFHRLTAFFTNLDLEDMWQKPQVLDRCDKCRMCIKSCPASAISMDRFLIRADRCLTYLNEKPASAPFPTKVALDWHNAIVGCMRCQEVCPENRDIKDWVVDGPHFSEEDTRLLLSADLSGEKAEGLAARLEPFGLDLTIFPRNLEVLL